MNDRALKVLEQYDLEIISTRRGRGSYICETPQGLRILCDYSGSENKALFQNCVMEKIREGGYEKVDRILPNKEGNLISRDWEENKYVVKEWYVGRECDTASESEVLAAVSNLARLHKLMHFEEENPFATRFTARLPIEEVRAQNAELRKIRSFVRKKNAKCDFERLFLECFTKYYEQAVEAERKLELVQAMEAERKRGTEQIAEAERKLGTAQIAEAGQKLESVQSVETEKKLGTVQEGSREKTGHRTVYTGDVCHGDYNHHHVLMSGYDIATTNFECCKFDYQVNDLYLFMRKILEKHDWNQRLGMRMMEQYTQVRPLPAGERRLLYVRMLYPEKFRKLANHYYGSNKAWVSGRFLEKLEALNSQEEKKEKFVKMLEK